MDRQLAQHFEWDVRKIFKHDGETTSRVYSKPWTADAFWNFQSRIPKGARPLCFILYADKSKLSSFGTEMAYPVIARYTNLPVEIRNSNGTGGGRVIGWLLIVSPENPEDSKETAFVNFKREVWHRAFRRIIESIIEKSKTVAGFGAPMALTNYFTLASSYYLPTMKNNALCLLSGALAANSPARHHLWREFKALAQTWGGAASKVDQQFDLVPRWRGLHHFPAVMKVSFTDGTKFEDISKVVVFAAHNVIPQDSKKGWQLLYCLRSLSILDLLLSLEAHTEKTILAGRNELKKFADFMENYILLFSGSAEEDNEKVKDWNFPKMHALVHGFDDIEAKGASRNYNTKPNEKFHGPLRKLYLNQDQFQECCTSDLEVRSFCVYFSTNPGPIDELDAVASCHVQTLDDDDNVEDALGSTQEQDIGPSLGPTLTVHDGSSHQGRSTTFGAGAVVLRSQQPPVTLKTLEGTNAENPTFRNFRARLATWLTVVLPQYNFSFAPGCTRVEFQDDDKITEYRSMKVCYESKVNWEQYLDYLYCSPNFHGRKRYDFVILMTTEGFIFAELKFIFTVSVAEDKYPICLVCPLDASTGPLQAKEKDLRLRCLHARRSTEFFFAQSIVRGAPLIQDFNKHGDYLVMDVVDHTGDLFICCNEISGW
ncbi:hypothetical protein H4582DRAFT_2069128 [Lactarius indigo]|nr:hypothetical protein H4582DRAFT_2069128 [Lactarius indigo]